MKYRNKKTGETIEAFTYSDTLYRITDSHVYRYIHKQLIETDYEPLPEEKVIPVRESDFLEIKEKCCRFVLVNWDFEISVGDKICIENKLNSLHFEVTYISDNHLEYWERTVKIVGFV